MLPFAFRIPSISGKTFVAAESLEIKYRWPVTMKIIGIDWCIRSADLANLALQTLRVLDDNNVSLFSNGSDGTVQEAPGLWMRGITPMNAIGLSGGRYWAMQRVVRAGDIWTFEYTNDAAVAVVPELFFRVERAVTVLGSAA